MNILGLQTLLKFIKTKILEIIGKKSKNNQENSCV